MNEYEAQRLENLKHKQRLLAELNLNSNPITSSVKQDSESTRPTKKRKISVENAHSRASARIASSGSKPSYREDAVEKYNFAESKPRYTKPTKGSKKAGSLANKLTDMRPLTPMTDAEELRSGWSAWKPIAAPPTRDEHNTFHFDDYPEFIPNKSPEEIIREGSFGGSYWRPLQSRKLGVLIEDDWKELPSSWYAGLDTNRYMTSPRYECEVNKFKVACGQSIEEWEAAGWIAFEHDIRGWFQWYCRFFQGRRCADDERQVSRWRKCLGETGRWRRMLLKKYVSLGVREVFDDGMDEDAPEVSPVMHQTCHHWAFEVRQNVLDEFWRSG